MNNEEPQKLVQKPLRTYEGDIAEALSHKQGGSMASIAIAEAKRNQEQSRVQENADSKTISNPLKGHVKQIIFLILSIILIGGGVYGAYYLYNKCVLATPTPTLQPLTTASLIPADKQDSLNLDASFSYPVNQIYSKLNANQLPAGKIYQLILNDTKGRVTGSSFLKGLNENIPDVLLRSLTDVWMLGTYTEDSGQKSTFIALTTDFFQNAFSGMLQWENSMPDDLSGILKYPRDFGTSGKFVDRQIKNRDVREFVDGNGTIRFLYTFIDKNILMITTSETALSAIIERIEKQTYVR